MPKICEITIVPCIFYPRVSNRLSANQQRSMSTFLPAAKINSNIVPQFEIGLIYYNPLGYACTTLFSFNQRQVHTVCTADSFSFAFLVKKNTLEVR